jgi:hypothetical protein
MHICLIEFNRTHFSWESIELWTQVICIEWTRILTSKSSELFPSKIDTHRNETNVNSFQRSKITFGCASRILEPVIHNESKCSFCLWRSIVYEIHSIHTERKTRFNQKLSWKLACLLFLNRMYLIDNRSSQAEWALAFIVDYWFRVLGTYIWKLYSNFKQLNNAVGSSHFDVCRSYSEKVPMICSLKFEFTRCKSLVFIVLLILMRNVSLIDLISFRSSHISDIELSILVFIIV